jgi:hypothetical protein
MQTPSLHHLSQKLQMLHYQQEGTVSSLKKISATLHGHEAQKSAASVAFTKVLKTQHRGEQAPQNGIRGLRNQLELAQGLLSTVQRIKTVMSPLVAEQQQLISSLQREEHLTKNLSQLRDNVLASREAQSIGDDEESLLVTTRYAQLSQDGMTGMRGALDSVYEPGSKVELHVERGEAGALLHESRNDRDVLTSLEQTSELTQYESSELIKDQTQIEKVTAASEAKDTAATHQGASDDAPPTVQVIEKRHDGGLTLSLTLGAHAYELRFLSVRNGAPLTVLITAHTAEGVNSVNTAKAAIADILSRQGYAGARIIMSQGR